MNTPSRPPPPPIPRRRSYRRWVLWPLVLLATGGLVLTAGLRVAENMARGRLDTLGARYGLNITAGSIDLPLFGAIALRDVVVHTRPTTPDAPSRELGRFELIETDLTLLSALGGARRPSAVRVVGGTIDVAVDHTGIVGLEIPPAAPNEEPASEKSGTLSAAFENVDINIAGSFDLQHLPDPLQAPLSAFARLNGNATATTGMVTGIATVPELRLRGLTGTVARDAERRVSAQLDGEMSQAGQDTASRWNAVATADGSLRFTSANKAFRILTRTPAGDVWLGFGGLTSDVSGLRLEGLAAATGSMATHVDSIAVHGPLPMPSPTSPKAFSAALKRAERIEVGGFAFRRDEEIFASNNITVMFGPSDGPFPDPTSIACSDMMVATAARGASLKLRVANISAAFSDLLKHAAAGDPLSGITSIVVTRPEGTVGLPANLAAVDARSEAPPEDDTPLPAADGAMPVLPNDDDALQARTPEDKRKADAARGAFGGLDRMIDGFRGRLAEVDQLLGGRAGALAQTAARLRPEIRGARIAFEDNAGKKILGLDDGALTLMPGASGELSLTFESRLVRDGVEQGRLSGSVGTDAAGRLERGSARVKGREVAARLARLVDHFSVQPDSEVDIDIAWTRPLDDAAPHHLKGHFKFKRFSFEYWRISDREITDLEGEIDFDASLDPVARRILIDLPAIRVGKALLAASADVRKPLGLKPSLNFRMRMPRQDCGDAAASIPRSLIPNLSTLALRGSMQFDANLVLDLEKPRELSLKVTGDVDSCEVLSLAPQIDPTRLRGRFVHHPREPGRGVLDHIAVGRGTREWLNSNEIPAVVKLAAWVTEDRKWSEHGGVRWDLVASALKIDLDHGRFIYGGSTITQQLVKNLYLTRGKNLARKFEEMIIAWQMERVLEKDEILTIYINCIEYGPDIYGIRAAARHYFGKRPQDLDALEAAFIMGLKPYPKAGYRQWTRSQLDYWWIRRVSYVLRLMAKYGPEIITLAEAEAFDPYQPVFRKPAAGELP